MHRFLIFVFFAVAFGLRGGVCAELIEFNRDVRPILSENCNACHGFDKNARKGKLRLDIRDESAAAVLKRDADGMSELIARITSGDEDEHMPPPEAKKRLTAAEIEILKRWVDQGAEYEDHWAWIAPKKAEVPAADVGREIDYFVGRLLEEKGLKLAPRAEDFRMARRLWLDLIGLPPTAEEVRAFSVKGYEQTVVDLLESPAFGEKWAIMWLDLARYADTVGYHGDQPVSVSPYRDYVINAFNTNKGYDDFVREQLAGDLLPDATDEERVATGFNRLNMTTEEGGSQPKEYLAKYAGDRVRTTSTVFMGATLGCAECHDHKFDPYTAKDFYSFAAFFADVEEVGVYSNRGRPPEMVVHSAETKREMEVVAAQLEEARGELEVEPSELGEGQATWLARVAGDLENREPFDFVWLEDEVPGGGQVSGDWKGNDKHVFSGKRAWRQQAAEGVAVQQYFREVAEPVVLGEGDRFFVMVRMSKESPPEELMLQVHSKSSGGWEHRAFWGADKIGYGGIGTDGVNHRAMGELPELGEWVRLEVSAEAIGFKVGDEVDGLSFDQYGGMVDWDRAGVVTSGGTEETRALSADLVAAVEVGDGQRDAAQRALIANYYRSIAPELEKRREAVVGLEKRLAELQVQGTRTLITVSQEPRVMRVLPRGNWLDESGEVVLPAVPGFLAGEMEAKERLTRLDLAEWLVSGENPLTARVFVNRVWKQLFGTGMSKVLDDVGTQGEWPVHPELLDWLAVDFVESGWDVKRLIRMIVMSETYRQSSKPNPVLNEMDPYNRLLARQSSFRMDAELVRDQFLAVSGQLVRETGGASVFPYQPAGLYRHLNFPKREYQASMDENQWRRGVYTHWQRTFLHPMLKAFDAPSRDECAANRPRSNTPVQALALLNDPSQVEAARVFAGRILNEGSGEFGQRLEWAFMEALSRAPTAAEVAVLQPLYEGHLAKFKENPTATEKYLSVGNSKVEGAAEKPEQAAWMSVARAVFNLHEMITRY